MRMCASRPQATDLVYLYYLGIWDSLLEGRIKLQKALLIINQLPQPDVWDMFIDTCGPQYNSALAESKYCRTCTKNMYFI